MSLSLIYRNKAKPDNPCHTHMLPAEVLQASLCDLSSVPAHLNLDSGPDPKDREHLALLLQALVIKICERIGKAREYFHIVMGEEQVLKSMGHQNWLQHLQI